MYRYLSTRLNQLGIRQKDLARILDLTPASISHRFTGRVPWTIDEMYRILEICRAVPEDLHIYFPPKGSHLSKSISRQADKLPLYLTVKIEQPTTDNLQISCSIQQYKVP